MAEVLKKFGRYFLLDQIAQGGMAEICRARLASAEGAGRLIVIKRVQAGYGQNSEFLQMFKSEIKVMMGFNHPNVVQLYDFGEEQNQPYIAMEFVDGKNLRQFISRSNEIKQSLPIELAVYIIEQAARGLHYAHTFKDKMSGQSLNIVHRDISPQNILLSYDGSVKVIDFGIAKATVNIESTRAGVIKGKPSYLSPEQITGEPLDARCDIFALGIVLWELLAGRKLFAGDNDLAILKLIESCQTHVKAPSTINTKIPKELDYIVLKSLAKQKEKRYQSAEELQRALHRFLYSFAPEFNPGDLSYYAKELFKDEIVEDRKNIQKLNEKVEQLLNFNTQTFVAPQLDLDHVATAAPRAQEDPTSVASIGPRPTGARDAFNSTVIEGAEIEIETSSGVSHASGFVKNEGIRDQSQSRPASTGLTYGSGISASQQRFFDDVRSESGGKKTYLMIAAAVLAVAFIGPKFGIEVPVLSDFVAKLTSNWAGGNLVIKGDQKKAMVMLNGRIVAKSLPAIVEAPVGAPFHLVVKGHNSLFEQDMTVKKGEKKVVAVTFGSRAPAEISVLNNTPDSGDSGPAILNRGILLRLNISPGGKPPKVMINGKLLDPNSFAIEVPLDSPLELIAERPGYRLFRREFVLDSQQVGKQKEWMMEVQLEPVRFGYVSIRSTPSADAIIMIDGKPWIKKTPLEHEKLPIGAYNIRLVNEVLGMEKTVTVSVQEGRVVNVDTRLEIKD